MDAAFHRLRVDQGGCLVNPPELLDAFRAFEAGSLRDEQLPDSGSGNCRYAEKCRKE